MSVYLNCLDTPLTAGRPAAHYLGVETAGLRRRLEQHAMALPVWVPWLHEGAGGWRTTNGGALFLAFANERGIPWELTRTWPGGDKHLERWIKDHLKNSRLLCPRCTPGTKRGLFIVGADRWWSPLRGEQSVPVMFQRDKVRKPIRFRSTDVQQHSRARA